MPPCEEKINGGLQTGRGTKGLAAEHEPDRGKVNGKVQKKEWKRIKRKFKKGKITLHLWGFVKARGVSGRQVHLKLKKKPLLRRIRPKDVPLASREGFSLVALPLVLSRGNRRGKENWSWASTRVDGFCVRLVQFSELRRGTVLEKRRETKGKKSETASYQWQGRGGGERVANSTIIESCADAGNFLKGRLLRTCGGAKIC